MSSSPVPFKSAPKKFIKRPDDKALKAEIDELKNEIKKLDLSNNDLNGQISKLQIDQSVMDKRNKLQAELKGLIAKQANVKNERNAINDQIKAVDAQLKKRIAEIQAQTSKNSFKNVEEIDARIKYLDGLIDAGDLKLADERRFVKEMSGLRKLRKDFGGIEKIQALIDQDKEKIAELKKKLSGVQNKEIQAQFEAIQKELDEINESNKTIISQRNELYDKRAAVKKQKDEKYDQIRKLRVEFDEKFANFKKQLAEEKKKRDEEYKAKLLEEKQQKRKEFAQQQLAEASIPAFTAEINSIHNLLAHFDPTYVKPAPKKASNGESSTLPTNDNIRKVEFPEDLVVIKKEQEDFFTGSKSKKSAKHKKKSKNFNVAPDVVVALSDLSIPFPTKEEEVEPTVKILKETLVALEEKQEEQTKTNIEKAKARIAKLEAEEDAAEAAEEAETATPEVEVEAEEVDA
ncbi:multicopy suppressor of BFA-induced lethality ER-golgi vesicle-tethering protein p115 [Spathaspora passalidarum NRRL Y-27907]|uniref:Multicopy suppressor of BFA-induced lethality ER-golgi vesicle-tethering protein p115 n=1 Tax=Spathaspora passalidarum (strain NRRL Y-27907 / 11-Y1) TaxID=619300 RepID=G3AGS2_SPAPN|nr:multicopy suppressor of BFA-induced lethality ER-golgi vesicle-tethering protein p115 [Spathaspora passalidarum NRRL Y-27907]EGW35405.1 multicopy suppressor of BFA-induced lethality ER-golgi vesicle-tethering protein p115 [Spathaspora passalidarum NRRL Y-27907]